MAREVLKTHQQVGAGRQRVAHHIHIAVARRELRAQSQRHLARTCHRQLPQAADLVHVHTGLWQLQRRQIDARFGA